uniref:Uncharacterized protein n=1 Tax=Daucus carota subsp. sativus TaxID=79200 RepID=A0A166APK1_DAUCS
MTESNMISGVSQSGISSANGTMMPTPGMGQQGQYLNFFTVLVLASEYLSSSLLASIARTNSKTLEGTKTSVRPCWYNVGSFRREQTDLLRNFCPVKAVNASRNVDTENCMVN